MSTLFDSVELAPRDPILGLNEQFNADTRPGKVNLGVGVYYDDQGRIPLLGAVRKAEAARIEAAAARGYLPIEGIAGYKGAQALLLGNDSPLAAAGRVLTTQALGGTGALKIGADFLHQLLPGSKVLISNPSWENHRALFERAGFEVGTYTYYDAATRGLNFEGMLADLKAAPADRRRAARLLPQPDRRGSHVRAVEADRRRRQAEPAGPVPGHRLPGLRRRPAGRRRGCAHVRRAGPDDVHQLLVLQVPRCMANASAP